MRDREKRVDRLSIVFFVLLEDFEKQIKTPFGKKKTAETLVDPGRVGSRPDSLSLTCLVLVFSATSFSELAHECVLPPVNFRYELGFADYVPLQILDQLTQFLPGTSPFVVLQDVEAVAFPQYQETGHNHPSGSWDPL